jgi:GAF domain-containing protein
MMGLENAARLTALYRLALLDSPNEEAFDRFTKMLTKLANVPVAIISFIDDRRHSIKSEVGLPEPLASSRQVPMTHSYCKYVVNSGSELIVEDTREHSLLHDNPAITELNAIAYAGVPLVTSDGHALGSLCILDDKPRAWQPEELEILRDMATSVSTTLDLRKTVLDLQESMKREEILQEKVTELEIFIDTKKQRSVDEIVNTEFFDSIVQKSKAIRSQNAGQAGDTQD